MRASRITLANFRNYTNVEVELEPDGLTVVAGSNGQGKTNLLEGLGYLCLGASFRQAPREALVRFGEDRAVLRAEGSDGPRKLLLEVGIPRSGREHFQVNRQPLTRRSQLLGAGLASVFSPDDLGLVKGGPSGRRGMLDDLLGGLDVRAATLISQVERVLRQRGSILRKIGSWASGSERASLDVWDAQLADLGEALADKRSELVGKLQPLLAAAYGSLVNGDDRVSLTYKRSWTGDLADALARAREEDLARGASTVGPHRDELLIGLMGMPARTHASEGEQRSLALGIRLACHEVALEERGEPPLLLLDDVFSELDSSRSEALFRLLPPGQTVLTTAGPLPPAARPDLVLSVAQGRATVVAPER